ncbi:MAG: histidine phosphatase family protein [Desulfobacterales bacterium]|nr:histidine phosphatase family protein [Desulfobacterales bacterium]
MDGSPRRGRGVFRGPGSRDPLLPHPPRRERGECPAGHAGAPGPSPESPRRGPGCRGGRLAGRQGGRPPLRLPLRRAFRSAEIIAARANLPGPLPEPVFTELETGIFTGLSVDEIRERYPEVYEEFLLAKLGRGARGGELRGPVRPRPAGLGVPQGPGG